MDYNKLLKKYKKLVKECMKDLKVYETEFDTIINIYSGMLAQYEILNQKLIESDFNIEVETQRGGTRKSALATATEKLRDQLIMYSDRLLLNPKTLNNAKLAVGGETSKIEKLLLELSDDKENSHE